MLESALIGAPPVSSGDKLIYKALAELSPIILKEAQTAQVQHAPHQTRAPNMIVGGSFAILLVMIITLARLWVRKYRSRAIGADDILIIPAAIGCVAYISLDIAQESAGCLGKHIYECTYQEFRWFYELAHCCFPIFYFTVFCVKISITLANRRITGMTSNKWQIAHWTYLALLICIMPICVFLNIFPCSPIATYFTLQSIAEVADPKTIKCLDQNAISLATRYLHIITDWLLLPVPLIIIWRLQMPVSRKVRLMLVFCVGLISSVASIIRNVLTERLVTDVDVTYDYYTIYAWNIVDIFFATIVASLPALNGVLDQGIKKMMTIGSGSSSGLLSWFQSLVSNNWNSQSYGTKLSDKDAGNGFSKGLTRDKSSVAFRQLEEPILHRAADIELQSPPAH